MDPASLVPRLERFGAARVLVLGDVMLDHYVYGAVTRLSPEAPIPVIHVERERFLPGGAANVARNVAALGGQAVLVGLIGEDDGARTLCDLLGRQPAIDARLIVDAGRATTQKTRFVADRQQMLRADRESPILAEGALAAALVEAAVAALGRADIVILSDYGKGVLSGTVLRSVIEEARRRGLPVIADPKSRSFERYKGVSILTPNRKEIAAATGHSAEDDTGAAAAGRAVVESCGIDAVLATRGEQGMTLVRADEPPVHLQAEAREVFDVTGAGDTVVATLALATASGAPLVEAARLANLAAGLVVGKIGTATVTLAELAAALQTEALTRTEAKVVTLETALEHVAGWRAMGERIGFTNGCFDLIHPGHITLLEKARAACSRLIVGLNTDESVQRLKGPDRPVQNGTARALVLASLKPVDLVVPFDADTPIDLIHAIHPDVLVKGSDYRLDQVVGASFVQSYGGQVLLVDVVPGHSTTAMIGRMGKTAPAA
jgi:D-beta-D-heptose 7-phosphate kinase / D-beta-D-heptose 1-phosphate adenosyltransferase